MYIPYIKHHGILGQKWGVRRYQNANGSLTSASKKRYNQTNSTKQNDNDKNRKHGLSDKQKKAIAIGATVAAVALVSYGAYKLNQNGQLDKFIDVGKNKVNNLLANNGGSVLTGFDSDTKFDFDINNIPNSKVSFNNNSNVTNTVNKVADGFRKLNRKETVSEVINKVNPTNSHNNCYNVVVGTVARLCGLDVTAKGDTQGGKGMSFDDVCKVFKLNPDNETQVRRMMNPSVDKISNLISKKYAEGDVGAIGISWNEKYSHDDESGHTLNWIIQKGVVNFIDGQAGIESDKLKNILKEYLNTNKEASIAKFANTIDGIDLENDINIELFKKMVN